jgi:hypothetical protein
VAVVSAVVSAIVVTGSVADNGALVAGAAVPGPAEHAASVRSIASGRIGIEATTDDRRAAMNILGP